MSTSQTPMTRTNWGRWGADDELGALNLITPQKRLADAAAVRTGRLYGLGRPLKRVTSHEGEYRIPFQRLTLMSDNDQEYWEYVGESMGAAAPGTGANEDVVITPTHMGTHLDALAHVYDDGKLYNGYPQAFSSVTGGARDTIDKIEGIAGRGVLLDVPAHLGVPFLEAGYRVSDELLEEVRVAQGTEIRPGDVVLIRVGHLEMLADAAARGEEAPGQAGVDLSSVAFFDRYEPALVGSDNQAVECIPFDERFLSVHVQLIVHRGIHLLENVELSDLAADGCHEFLFVLGPLRIAGASGSPVNPIAIG